MKALADDNLNFENTMNSVCDGKENIMEKGENEFSPFPLTFSKVVYIRGERGGSLNLETVWSRVHMIFPHGIKDLVHFCGQSRTIVHRT